MRHWRSRDAARTWIWMEKEIALMSIARITNTMMHTRTALITSITVMEILSTT